MKVGETVLEKVVRHLKRLNSRLENGEEDRPRPNYQVAINDDGSGWIQEPMQGGRLLFKFHELSGLVEFLEAPLAEQVQMIRLSR